MERESDRVLRDRIRRLLAKPPEERTHFLRKRVPGFVFVTVATVARRRDYARARFAAATKSAEQRQFANLEMELILFGVSYWD